MSNQQQASSNLLEDEISQYLIDNPDYFERNQELLANLKLDHSAYGSISLIERQLLNLRDKESSLKQQLSEMINTAKMNSDLLTHCSNLTVAIIKATSKQELFDTVKKELTNSFGIDNCQIWLNGTSKDLLRVNYGDLEMIKQLTDHIFITNEPLCGRVSDSIAQLFSGDKSIQSYAMIPLGKSANIGSIVLGSKDENLFTADMGTLFLRLIGDVTEARFDIHGV